MVSTKLKFFVDHLKDLGQCSPDDLDDAIDVLEFETKMLQLACLHDLFLRDVVNVAGSTFKLVRDADWSPGNGKRNWDKGSPRINWTRHCFSNSDANKQACPIDKWIWILNFTLFNAHQHNKASDRERRGKIGWASLTETTTDIHSTSTLQR